MMCKANGKLCAGIFKQSIGARNRVGIELSFRLARLQSLAELVPWNRFLGSLKVRNFGLRNPCCITNYKLQINFQRERRHLKKFIQRIQRIYKEKTSPIILWEVEKKAKVLSS
jgi:hypothetical protein